MTPARTARRQRPPDGLGLLRSSVCCSGQPFCERVVGGAAQHNALELPAIPLLLHKYSVHYLFIYSRQNLSRYLVSRQVPVRINRRPSRLCCRSGYLYWRGRYRWCQSLRPTCSTTYRHAIGFFYLSSLFSGSKPLPTTYSG